MGRVRPQDPHQRKNPWMRGLSWAARQRPVTWYLVNVGGKVDPVLMRMTGGRVKTTLNAPTILLVHTGRKSGEKRRTPLAYFTDGDDVVLIASRGGHEKNPPWYHNLRANPEVELWTGHEGGRYRASEAEGAERERLWELATEFYPGFDSYQRRAGSRRIPVIVCSPLEE
jgi:deazaflavin-dependent oxidoreductase (nitroreductase family)